MGGLLAIVVYMVDIPQKLGWKQNNPKTETLNKLRIQDYPFEGQILDLQGKGLEGVTVSLIVPGQEPMVVHTHDTGVFAFKVLTETEKPATLQAQKPGFKPKRRNVTIPDQRYILKMEPISAEAQP